MMLTEQIIVGALPNNKDNVDSAKESPSLGALHMHSAIEGSHSENHPHGIFSSSSSASSDKSKGLTDKDTVYHEFEMSTLHILPTLHANPSDRTSIATPVISLKLVNHSTMISQDDNNDIDLSLSESLDSVVSGQMRRVQQMELQNITTNYVINEEPEEEKITRAANPAVKCNSVEAGENNSESDDYHNIHKHVGDVTHDAHLREECNEIRKGFTNNYMQFKWQKLIRNRLFYTRIPTCLIAILLLFVSVTYCIGQTCETQLDLITKCSKPKTTQEIWKHSQEAQLRHNKLNNTQITSETQWGWTDDECWSTKTSEINEKTLWFMNKYTYKMVRNPFNAKTILFAFVSVYSLVVIFYGIAATINDVIDVKNNALHKKTNMYNDSSKKKKESWWFNHFRAIKKWYSDNMATDTTGWIVMMFMFELVEIIVQYQALLLYNGYNVFDKHNEDNIYLANKPHLILVFAIILAFNCMASGICWLCYTLCNNECHGLCFKLTLLYVDQVSDFLYTIFPYIVIFADGYTQNPKDKFVWIAQLNIDSNLAFAAAFIPILFLCNKCLFITIHLVQKLRNEYYEKWQFIQNVLNQTDAKLIAYQARLRGFKNQKSFKLAIDEKEIYDHQGKFQLNLRTVTKAKKSHIRSVCRIIIVVVSLLYFCLATQILVYTTTYFREAEKYCYQIDESKYFDDNDGWLLYDDNATFITEEEMDLMANNPELFLWDKCLYKVYPFSYSGEYECQCRVFVIDWETDLKSTSEDRFVYFNITQPKLLTAMLQHWYMLEKFSTGKTEDSIAGSVHFEQNMITARMLRAFSWHSLSVTGIDEGISMKLWSQLEYFRIENTQFIQSLPSDFNQLHSLKFFKSFFSGLREFPQELCSLDNLKIIQIEFTFAMTIIPHCVARLVELEQFVINGAVNLAYFPIELLSLPKLEDVSLWRATYLTYENLLTFNNISNVSDFNEKFKWNNYTNYYLSMTPLCDNYNISKLPIKLQQFLNKTNNNDASTCSNACDDDYEGFCPSSSFGDGKCDFGCNDGRCSFDGGDCHQLCFDSPFSNCTWDLFMNDVCDEECNNIYCLIVAFGTRTFARGFADHHNCKLATTADISNITQAQWEVVCYQSKYDNIYNTEYDCNIQWVGDGWCDDACRTDQCQNDGGDCDTGCVDDSCNLVLNAWSVVVSGEDDVYLMSSVYICDIWPTIQIFFTLPDVITCEYVIERSDLNNDQHLNFKEFVIASGIIHKAQQFHDDDSVDFLDMIDIHLWRSKQINCSSCVGIENYNLEFKL